MNRLKTNKKIRVVKGYYNSQYSCRNKPSNYYNKRYNRNKGSRCRDDSNCSEICRNINISRLNRTECLNAPIEVITKIEAGVTELINISDVKNVNIDASLISGILDIDYVMKDIIEKQMSEGDLKSFLAWIALNQDIASVFLCESRSKIPEISFERLGKFQADTSIKEELTGLNVGLIQNDDSFLYLAATENNEDAFKMAYDAILNTPFCTTKECKMNILCARELKSIRRSRILGTSYMQTCKTSAVSGRSRGNTLCYIHGVTVWNYLNELINNNTIHDLHFKEKSDEITVKKCNDHCDNTANNCDRIQK